MADSQIHPGANGMSENGVAESLTEELTLGYRPSNPLEAMWAAGGDLPQFTMRREIPLMEIHPIVSSALEYYRSGIANAEFWGGPDHQNPQNDQGKPISLNQKVSQFVLAHCERFWERAVPLIQQGAYPYGWAAGEHVYKEASGMMVWDHMKDFHPTNAFILTLGYKPIGVRITNIREKQPVDLWLASESVPAKACWYPHRPRFGQVYGRSQLTGAWLPWRMLGFRDGMDQIISAAVYRAGWKGPVVKFPPGHSAPTAQSGVPATRTDGGGLPRRENRDVARQIMEWLKAGAGVAISSQQYPDGGGAMWEVDFPEHVMDVSPLVNAAKWAEDRIMLGIGVPPELVQASETGSGYSGRSIPREAFLDGQQRIADAMLQLFVEQVIRPLVLWNFGDIPFSVSCKSLLKTQADDKQGEEPGQKPAAPQGPQQGNQPPAPPPQPAAQQPPGQPALSLEDSLLARVADAVKGVLSEHKPAPEIHLAIHNHTKGRWVTTEKGRHVYISDEGIHPHGPGTPAIKERKGKAETLWQKIKRRVKGVSSTMARGAAKLHMAAESLPERIDDFVLEVAKERGLPPEHVERLKKINRVVNAVVSATVSAATADIPGSRGPAETLADEVAKKAPLGSLGYLVYSTVRNPLATLRAAKAALAGRKQGTSMSVEHAPKGGVAVKGKDYKGGQFIPSKTASAKKEKEKEKEEPEEWDGTIDGGAVLAGNTWARENYAQWYDGDGNEHTIYLEDGEFETPDGETITVYRWVSFDERDDSRDEEGEWTTEEDTALQDGRDYAKSSHQDVDPTDDDIPNDDGASWNSRDYVSEYFSEGATRQVRLDEMEFEFAGRTHTAYRWTTRFDADGDWTLSRRDAIRDGEEYAESMHEEDEDDDENEDELIETLLDGDRDKAGKLLGAPEGASVKLSFDDDSISVDITHKYLETCERTIGTDDEGNKFIHNDYLRVTADAPRGFGSELFSRQVEAAREAGFAYIETHAAGSYGNPHFNGYYTWPALGYDQPLDELARQGASGRRCAQKAALVFPDAESVLDIFDVAEVTGLSEVDAQEIREKCAAVDRKLGKEPKDRTIITGADWWKVHGTGMEHARFDLGENSRSAKWHNLSTKKKK